MGVCVYWVEGIIRNFSHKYIFTSGSTEMRKYYYLLVRHKEKINMNNLKFDILGKMNLIFHYKIKSALFLSCFSFGTLYSVYYKLILATSAL